METMDVVFTNLRILAPSDKDIEETKKSIEVLKMLWTNLDINITPKAHILFVHTLDQYKRFGGIADMVEDFVEKSHQTGKKLDHLVARMNSQCYYQQELVKIRRQWLASDPRVTLQKDKVHEASKRRLKNSPKNSKKISKHELKTLKRNRISKKEYYVKTNNDP